jgi:hypothetical protein
MKMPTSPKKTPKVRTKSEGAELSDSEKSPDVRNVPVLSQPERVALPALEQPSRVVLPPMTQQQVVRPKTPNTLHVNFNSQVSSKSPPPSKIDKSPLWSKSSKTSGGTTAKSPTAVIINRYPSSASKNAIYRGRSFSNASRISETKGAKSPDDGGAKPNEPGSPDFDYFISETCV